MRSIPAGPGSRFESPLAQRELFLSGIRSSRAFRLVSKRRRLSLAATSEAGYFGARRRSVAMSPSVQGLYCTMCTSPSASLFQSYNGTGGRVSGGTGTACCLQSGKKKTGAWSEGNYQDFPISVPEMEPICSLHYCRSEIGKDLAMVRLLSILTFSALCILSGRASADTLKPDERVSEISSRQRCACTSVVHYGRYRVRTAYLIGYDPLPYRYGSTSVWARPYRYYWR